MKKSNISKIKVLVGILIVVILSSSARIRNLFSSLELILALATVLLSFFYTFRKAKKLGLYYTSMLLFGLAMLIIFWSFIYFVFSKQ